MVAKIVVAALGAIAVVDSEGKEEEESLRWQGQTLEDEEDGDLLPTLEAAFE
jgi:hypothetical protein